VPARRCARCASGIVVGQGDEIVLMQRWLRDRHEMVPAGDATHDMMPGMDHTLMPGMLTPQQLMQLDSARGTEFDRLFLVFMIQHHTGAITMVNELFGSQGGGEEEIVFRFASDVYADQTTEIARMNRMLDALKRSPREIRLDLPVRHRCARPCACAHSAKLDMSTTAPVPDRRVDCERANRTPRKRSGT